MPVIEGGSGMRVGGLFFILMRWNAASRAPSCFSFYNEVNDFVVNFVWVAWDGKCGAWDLGLRQISAILDDFLGVGIRVLLASGSNSLLSVFETTFWLRIC